MTAEHVFYYVLSVLNARAYQDTYREQLGTDFPHIPFVKRGDDFAAMAELGRQLAFIQLEQGDTGQIGFEIIDSPNIEASEVRYFNDSRSVQINRAGSRFTNIDPAVWNYSIDGYRQVLEGWLKSRDERRFVLDYSGQPNNEVLIDEFRRIAHSIVLSLPILQSISSTWKAITTFEAS